MVAAVDRVLLSFSFLPTGLAGSSHVSSLGSSRHTDVWAPATRRYGPRATPTTRSRRRALLSAARTPERVQSSTSCAHKLSPRVRSPEFEHGTPRLSLDATWRPRRCSTSPTSSSLPAAAAAATGPSSACSRHARPSCTGAAGGRWP